MTRKPGLAWTGKDSSDRLVIFTERIDTLNFLEANLKDDLKLKDEQVAKLHGGLSDIDQQHIVEAFGKEKSKVRLLLASDVASEGINLHYLSHKMIHFDIPWSLMVFQQRNGRIDRYGQEGQPHILYLLTDSSNPKIKGDMRILELLIRKDRQAEENIGDPSAFMKVYNVEDEENVTAMAMENGKSVDEFEKELDDAIQFNPLELLLSQDTPPADENLENTTAAIPSIFSDDWTYFKEASEFIKSRQPFDVTFDRDGYVNIAFSTELRQRFQNLPKEIVSDSGEFILTPDHRQIQREIKEARKEQLAWPNIHLLWEMHPLVEWINDKVLAAFGRHEAPVMTLQGILDPNEVIFLIYGLIPNRQSHPIIYRWFGIQFDNGKLAETLEMEQILNRTKLGKTPLSNRNQDVDIAAIKSMLPAAINEARIWMTLYREKFECENNPKLERRLKELEELKKRRVAAQKQLYLFDVAPSTRNQAKLDREKRKIEKIFSEYYRWVEDSMTTEDNPYLRVVAVLRGE